MAYTPLRPSCWRLAPSLVALAFCALADAQAQDSGASDVDLLMLTPASVGRTLPPAWKTRAVRGARVPSTDIVDSLGHVFLRVSGTNRAAWFYRELAQPFDARAGRLRWSWRIRLAPVGASSASPTTDDAALRVFVVFAQHNRFALTPRALFYTVADGEPPRSDGQAANAATAVIVGRPAHARQWTNVEADPFRDYRRLWGGTAPRIVAIGVMQDTDQTMTPAVGELLRLHWSLVDAVSR